MVYTKWWHSLLIGISVATWGFAQPLFGYVSSNNTLPNATALNILVFVAIYQFIPVAFVFALDRAVVRIGKAVLQRIFRVALFVPSILIFLWAVHVDREIGDFGSWPLGTNIFLAVVLIAGLLALAFRIFQPLNLLFTYLAVVSLALTAIFFAEMDITSRPWSDWKVQESSIDRVALTQQTPVFIIVFDALGGQVLFGDGEIDPIRFPNFSELGNDSAVFTNATSNYMDTVFSVPSMLGGRYFRDGLSTANLYDGESPWSGSLLNILADEGYIVEFHSGTLKCRDGFLLCNERGLWSTRNIHVAARNFATWFLPKDVARFIRSSIINVFPSEIEFRIPLETAHRNDIELWSGVVDRISAEQTPGRAYLVHSLLTHRPYEFERDGNRVRTLTPDMLSGDFDVMAQAYEEQVMFADKKLGELIGKLKSEGLYDRSLIVLIGDHGPRALGLEHSDSGYPSESDFPDELNNMIPWVPVFIHGPGVEPQVSSLEVQLIDLFPSLLDVLGFEAPSDLVGASVFDRARPDKKRIFIATPIDGGPGERITYMQDADTGQWRRQAPNKESDDGDRP